MDHRENMKTLAAKSVDVRYWIFNAGLMLTLPLPFLCTLAPAVMLGGKALELALVFLGLMLAVAMSVAWYYYRKAMRLQQEPERFLHCIGTPVHMEADFWGAIRMEVELWDGEQTVKAWTGPVFAARVFSSRYFGDYFGQPLELLWDPQGQRLLVLGKQGEYRF